MPGDTVPFGSGPKLSGTLPAVLGTNENIQMLWLKNNYISGTLPPAWKELGNTLLELDLSRGMCSKCSLCDPARLRRRLRVHLAALGTSALPG